MLTSALAGQTLAVYFLMLSFGRWPKTVRFERILMTFVPMMCKTG